MNLYLDTSHFLSIGILDDEFNWLHFERQLKLQHSADIHALIYQILEKNSTSAENIKSLFLCNGPGSYTGIRLGEGIAQVFELVGTKIYAFHHFEVPKILGVKKGEWICHAFKGEVFQYSWDNDSDEIKLMALASWSHEGRKLYSHQPEGPWQAHAAIDSSQLVEESAKALFSHLVSEQIRREPYYFRPLETEFKRSVE